MDPATDVLFRAWNTDPPTLQHGDAVLLLGLDPHPEADELAPARVDVVDPWAMTREAWAMVGHGCDVDEDGIVGGAYAAALVRPERQVQGRRGRLARALRALRPGGLLVVALPTREGGKRLASELAELGAQVEDEDSKARCRWVRARRPEDLTDVELDAVLAEDAPRKVLDGTFWSRPGLFSWDEADPGSRLLAASLPDRLGETVADAGAGWGWLSRQILDAPERCERLHLLEADARALALAERNLEDHADRIALHHVDATQPWPVKRLDAVVTNPPFHRHGRHDLGLTEAFLSNAARALLPGGRIWAVAKIDVPLGRLLSGCGLRVEEVATKGSYRVMYGARPRG